MKLSKFTLSDDIEEFEGCADGTNWGKWAVCFSREQLCEFLGSMPYDFRFDNDGKTEDDIETLKANIGALHLIVKNLVERIDDLEEDFFQHDDNRKLHND